MTPPSAAPADLIASVIKPSDVASVMDFGIKPEPVSSIVCFHKCIETKRIRFVTTSTV